MENGKGPSRFERLQRMEKRGLALGSRMTRCLFGKNDAKHQRNIREAFKKMLSPLIFTRSDFFFLKKTSSFMELWVFPPIFWFWFCVSIEFLSKSPNNSLWVSLPDRCDCSELASFVSNVSAHRKSAQRDLLGLVPRLAPQGLEHSLHSPGR